MTQFLLNFKSGLQKIFQDKDALNTILLVLGEAIIYLLGNIFEIETILSLVVFAILCLVIQKGFDPSKKILQIIVYGELVLFLFLLFFKKPVHEPTR